MALFVYKSSAGSGKTYTLVKEYIKWAIGNNSDDYFTSILAITFTNKAASEMKERLLNVSYRAAFSKEENQMIKDISSEMGIPLSELKVKMKSFLLNILHKYHGLNISTIDKFTYKLLRAFSSDIQLPTDFKVTTKDDELIKKAVEQIIIKSGEDEYITTLLKKFNEQSLENESFFGITASLVKLVKVYLKDDAVEKLASLEKCDQIIFENIYHKTYEFLEQFKSKINSYENDYWSIAKNVNVDILPYKGKGFPSFFKKLSNPLDSDILLKSNNGNLDNHFEKNYNDNSKKKSEKKDDPIILELYKIYNNVVQFYNSSKAEIILQKLIYDNILTTALVAEICKAYQQLLIEEITLPVSEFHKKVNQLISNESAPFIYEKTGNRYNHYMIDEFQDTSKKQWENFLPLIEDSLAKGNHNLLVGDSKQSIYRWRGAEVNQFAMLPDLNLGKENAENKNRNENFKNHYTEILLDTNFRSEKNIVDFNNDFFRFASQLAGEKIQGIYKDCNQKSTKNKPENGHVQFLFNTKNRDNAEFYIEQIEQIIQNAISKGYQYKDIAILTRKNKLAKELAELLIINNYPVLSKESFSLVSSPKIYICFLTLKYIYFPDDKLNKLNFVKAIAEYFKYDYSEDELLRNVIAKSENENLKIFDFIIDRKKLIKLSLYSVIIEILNCYGFTSDNDAYVISLIDVCYKLDVSESINPIEFIELIEQGDDFNIQIPEELNAINILTIHKSKGLQFPIVIVPECDWEDKKTDQWIWIKTDKFKNWGIEDFVVKSSKLMALSSAEIYYDEEKTNENLDNINLLYVAFTRPEIALYGLFKSSIESISEKKDDEENEILNFANLIYKFFKNKSIDYQIGSLPAKENHLENEIKNFKFKNNAQLSLQNNNIKFAEKSINYSDEKQIKNKQYGIFLHSFIETFSTTKDIYKYEKDNINSISEEEKSALDKIKYLYYSSDLKDYFTEESEHFSEIEICNKNGKIFRIDRLIKLNNKWILLDFKTGKENTKDIEKVKEYLSVLSDSNIYVSNAYLYYFIDNKTVSVV